MKHLKIIVLLFLGMCYATNAQVLTKIDEVGFSNDGLIAIRKADSWGFLDINGMLVVDFRKDIVATPEAFPIFNNGLCLIKEERENIVYYGYINNKGETIIPTEYIAATPFENGFASVIKHYKTDTGGANILGKKIVIHSYNEMIIDTKNKLILHISGPNHMLFDNLKLQQNIPAIRSKFIGDHLVAVKEDDNTYSIHNLLKQ